MFKNIGEKIKTLSQIACIIGIFISIIAGLVSFAEGELLLGLVIILGGGLFSWIGSFFTYGFGELIEITIYISNRLYEIVKYVIHQNTIDKE